MNSHEYEEYVSDVVRSLSISKKANVYLNRKYTGVRQPGSYEIDVACEVWIDNALFFIIIVECKNWKTPVDRPQIQKLIQTRDAIAAHKAAFASPVGYTKEAIEVAKANGVALWVVAKGVFDDICGGGYAAISVAHIVSCNLRWLIYELLEYTGDFYEDFIPDYVSRREFEYETRDYRRLRILDTISAAKTKLVPLSWVRGRIDFLVKPELYFMRAKHNDPIVAALIVHTLQKLHLDTSLTSKVATRIMEYRSILINSGIKPKLAQKFVNGVIELITSDGADASERIGFALTVDSKCNHRKAKLLAPVDWLEENGWRIHLSTSERALRENIIWANVIWLLNAAGLLQESPR